ncbi:MAG TPA: lysylphosphatidylglycerol synthase transmembrane domain-containing protein [Polyangiaceae bacterium]|nr:lysylphosphatidylglycerol synthase transmembrane domain-containing protein [Polyangiaceae bacterium]
MSAGNDQSAQSVRGAPQTLLARTAPSVATPVAARARVGITSLGWLVGLAALAAVIAVALHFSEGREFVHLAQDAQPAWLVVAIALQLGTYASEGEVWQRVARACAISLRRSTTWRLSVAKLFVDQALPSGGVSGTLVIARSLEQRGVPRRAVGAGVAVDSASYHASYMACLAMAWLVTLPYHQANAAIGVASLLFVLFALTVTVGVLGLVGKSYAKLRRAARFVPPLKHLVELLESADPVLARSPRLLGEAVACQLSIFLLDAATLWVLIAALGVRAAPAGVFGSFMFATLFRTVGILPGGVGTFEATSVVALKLIGVSLPVALSATLLFRGLSFWLPILPGLWFSRQVVTGSPERRAATGVRIA